MDIQTIEKHAGDYAADRAHLAELVGRMQTEIDAVKQRYLPDIRSAVAQGGTSRDALHAAIEAAPTLFEKPKTRVLMGIKCGFRKLKGQVSFQDEGAIIERIRAQLPKTQADLLIRRKESVDKNACYDLTLADLKRLGISIADDEDTVVIKPADGGVDKVIDELLKEAEQIEAAA